MGIKPHAIPSGPPVRHTTRTAALLPALIAGIVCMLCLGACGTKKNTPYSRNWQAFTTRYNVYFNGAEHYKETLKEMEDKYEDDYTRLLLTHPAEARADSKMPQPSGSFSRTIEKMQKAIQLHSITKKPARRSSSPKDKAFRARDEFNPFLHNAWLMLGKAEYLDGDFLGAATTFLYTSRHFKWLPETVTEAKLWQARCYCALGWTYEAENILRLIKEKDLTSGSLRHLYSLVSADYLIRTERYAEAAGFLREAARSSSGSQKHRLWFLLGQIYSRLGEKKKAYDAFGKAGSGLSTPYRTKFNARIKQSEVFSGSDIRKEVGALRGMARYERNKEFLDQIYYAIGNLYLSRKDTAEARKNYLLAIEKSTRGGIDKALAQIALGGIYFSEGEYVKAQPCYAEAVPLLPDNYPGYKTLTMRSDVLDELALFYGNVHLQDSLLTLASLTPEQQREACARIVEELRRREEEERKAAEREQLAAGAAAALEANAAPRPTGAAAPRPMAMNADKSWYFYNSMTRNAGKTEFQRRWGARKLEDDWRRRDKTTFSLDSDDDRETAEDAAASGAPDPADSGKTVQPGADDPHNVEYYLRQIPSTPEEIRTANDIIQEGLYNMGVILKDRLEDYPAARREFTELDTRYPDNIYRLDAYYNLYLMAVRENDKTLAEHWRLRILSDFPDSAYGKAMADPAYFDNLRRMHELQESLYETAYSAYLDNDNGEVHRLAKEMETRYPLSPILPKFVFIDALSYLTEGDYALFRDRLTELLQKWPETDMTDMASGILKGLKAGRTPRAGVSNARGMIWNTRLSADAPEEAADSVAAKFTSEPDSPHYLVLAFPLDSVNPNLVLYDVAKFNFSSFAIKDFDLEPMRFSNIGLLVVKGFANLRELERYRSVMEKSGLSLPAGVRPVMISKSDFELLLREGRSFEEYFRYQEDAAVRKAEEDLLGPGMTMPGEESEPTTQKDNADG